MLDTVELEQVRDYIVKMLPKLLRSDPEIVTTIEGILAEQFPRRDEFARMLDELQRTREKVDLAFVEIEDLRVETRQRFDGVDERFDAVDKRFDAVDKRFDAVDKRFDGIDQSIADLKRDSLSTRRDLAKLQSGQDNIIKRMENLETWLKFVTGNLRNEKGQTLEDLVAASLRYGLKNQDILPEQIRLRQMLMDKEGLVFLPGFKTEIDLIVTNGRIVLFEVKASGDAQQVGLLALKVALVQKQNPDKKVQGVFITLIPTPEIQEACEYYSIELAS